MGDEATTQIGFFASYWSYAFAIAVAFYGDALVGTAAVDDALYDFMRYQGVQTNGSTLSPGEIPNVLDHINGGRGIFSSMAKVESVMTVLR